MTDRISILRQKMKEGGITNLLVSSLSDIYYLTGFTGSAAYLLVTPENPVFITDGRYTEQAGQQVVKGCEIEIVKDYKLAVKDFSSKAGNLHVTQSCTLTDYMIAKDNAEVQVDGANLIALMRRVKDAGELEKIRKMFRCAADAFSASLDSFKTGVSEVTWAAELEKNMKMNGAKSASFQTIVGSGARGALPHGIASEKIVEKGDAVVVDFGAKNEYCSDVTRLVMTADDAEVAAVAEIVRTALCKAKDAVRAGVKCTDIDSIARDYIKEKGYGDYFNHGLGHSLGVDVHENPRFNQTDETVLEENMVLTIEPGIYLPGRFGVRLEDTVAVKSDGCENLTAVFDEYVYKI